MKQTDLFEGTVVRAVRRLDELLGQVRAAPSNAAALVSPAARHQAPRSQSVAEAGARVRRRRAG